MYVLFLLDLSPILVVTLVAFQYFQRAAFCFLLCFNSTFIILSRRVSQIYYFVIEKKSLIFTLTFYQNHFRVLARKLKKAKNQIKGRDDAVGFSKLCHLVIFESPPTSFIPSSTYNIVHWCK